MKNENRHLASLASLVSQKDSGNTTIITSSTDVGVRLNNGRDGTRLGPKALSYHFLKMNNHLSHITGIKIVEVGSDTQERENFEGSQNLEAQLISKVLDDDFENLIHIGGGHDHVYPLLLSIQKLKSIKKILIINIDAHCDTRVDNNHHSGTPFRNFDNSCKMDATLIQVGIHKYANSELTLTSLKNINQKIVYQGESLNLDLKEFDNKDSIVLLSLDSDGLDSSIMRAVSAVNSQGVQFSEVADIIKQLKQLSCKKVFGIYEYNPKFDDLSNQGAKTLSHLIYNWLE